MDKIDYLILSELFKDASLSFAEVAKRVSVTPSAVRRKYQKMKKDGLIQRCIVSIDLSKLGYQGKAFFLITLSPTGSKSDTISYLTHLRNVIVVAELIGAYDLLAIAAISDLNSINELVTQVKNAPNLEKVDLECIDDCGFPIGPNYSKVLSQKTYALGTST